MADALAHVWAKSATRGRERGETLTAHTANVLRRLAGWRGRYPALAERTSRPDLWRLAAWACLLHDVGKVARGFQARLRGGPPFGHRHEVLSLVAVGWLEVDEETRGLVAAGVATHHRDLDTIFELYPPDLDARRRLLGELAAHDEAALRRWLAGEGAPDPRRWGFERVPALRDTAATDALAAAFRVLAVLRRELEALDATAPMALTARALRGLVLLADHAGSAHERLAAMPTLDTPAALMGHLRQVGWQRFFRHQESCAATDGHALVIAPTGSGKTEAALLWASRQREVGPGRPPVFYVLPYRASLNAMRVRIPERYGVPEGSVTLQHAKATADLYTMLMEHKAYAGERAAREARHERNLGQLMTAPLRVLTPYQLLRGVFGLPGHEATLTDAAGGLFVLDELHAYDVPRLALVLAMVRHLASDLGARFLAMSATFPRVLRDAWREGIGGEIAEIRADADTQREFRRHVLRVRTDELGAPDVLDAVAARQRAGEAVLVVATTVARAQGLFDRLRERVGAESVWLLHGRFTGADRAAKEGDLARRVGTGRRLLGAPGTILVATQVVEVSLDVDFDVLFTDPAPVEALIQRFGRVNRGRRGALREVTVCAPSDEVRGLVYPQGQVERALEILRPCAGRDIEEEALQAWVDAAYEGQAEAWRGELSRQVERAEAEILRANRPLTSHPELEQAFEALFDGCEIVPACFADEYRRLREDEPLQADRLRVPVSHVQWARLRRAGRLDGEIAHVQYDPVRGLDLSFRDDDA